MTSRSSMGKKGCPAPVAQPEQPGDDEFLARIRAKLPAKSQRTVEILDRVKSVYVTCGRDVALNDTLDRFLELILTSKRGRRDDGRIYFITGESGAGKTAAVEKLLADCAVLQPERKSYGLSGPVVSVSLKGPCTLNTLGEMILEKAGYPIVQKIGPSQLWKSLPDRLGHREILLVHVDETQNMLKHTEKDRDRKDLANALKGAMNHKDWPVSFIMSGLPQTNDLARLDEQFERRGFMQHLPDIDMENDNERKLVLNIIRKMSIAAEIDCGSILESDIPDRIAHAAKYRYGRTTQVVLAALQDAIRSNATTLHRDHFSRAYLSHSHARGYDEMNPFAINDWKALAPGSFLLDGGET
ncbi:MULTISPECIES: ATP-binding protein [unclassified Bradyrhizobium]|uniref:ATP-binding protein n=1 Tax=unclassified Bradyrhizobium TaxID=2631580 RepID=UPI0028E5452B|nr:MULTISPECIES: ATP-binding protein [unclassified Bradyrhizobium]